ncbi:MAG: type III toxin-antitoxin system ToxN/AbiQ family toxin [Treponema sp.]|nr:type III toxin-antitoxin system ToxN/AbiQ family toxin [Treponema sp.]
MSYKFVVISDKYIEYLRKTETRVMSNKADSRIYHRKYLGIIEKLNSFNYFIPLSSPKQKDYTQNGKIKNDSLITIYIKDSKRLYGTLRFNNMIPVPESEIENYDLNDEGDFKYKLIVFNELYFVRQNKDKIERTAKNLYEAKKNQEKKSNGQKPLLEMTLDFTLLESLCLNYKK